MDPITQGAFGAVLAQSTSKSRDLGKAALIGSIAGMAPDLDVIIRSSEDSLLAIEYYPCFTVYSHWRTDLRCRFISVADPSYGCQFFKNMCMVYRGVCDARAFRCVYKLRNAINVALFKPSLCVGYYLYY